ncbi:ATP-binding cassette domain-containing protein [Candidatus Roizmanbacteria bacterium]|jgi:ABC-type lipoprotein export system ATPase subunit|nr:ATP-binding cassette domain-containing protein [Candidatus Roizmanbacteria bacterium]
MDEKPLPFIQMRDIKKAFKNEAQVFYALKGINLGIDKGEFVAVIGKSGSGKSTLINMIAGIDRPTSGEIEIGKVHTHILNENQMAKWRGKNMGVVFQFFQLLPTLTTVENVMLPMDFCNVYPASQRRKKALELLDLVGVKEQADKLPSMLSGGQQQRVAIARALANDPPIIVADEPTGNLDSKTADQVFDLFSTLVKKGKTILMVTHDNDLAKRASRILIISDGEIIEEYLSQVFPSLSRDQLIWITPKLKIKKYRSGQTIIHKGEDHNKLFIITKGKVEVVLHTSTDQELVVSNFSKGNYFGEIELLRGGSKSIATIKVCPGQEVEAAEIDIKTFEELIKNSPQTKKQIENTAKDRLKEHYSSIKK